MGSGTYERSGARISTGASSGYEFVRFPNGESFDESTGIATLYFEIGFYVDTGDFYGATFHADGSSVDTFAVYGPNAYNVHGWTIQVPWNGYRHFWEKSYYTSYSSGYHESVVDFYWYPTLPTYTIAYSAGQGTGAPSSQTKEYGSSLKLSADVPTRTNYKFMGWTDGTTTYQPGGEYSANANASLTAIWELDFVPPAATLEAHRTTSASSANDDPNGEYGYASLEWSCDQTKGANSVQSIAAVESNGATVTFATPSGTSGTTIMHWPLAANSSCSLTVTVTDTNSQSTVKTVMLGTVNRAFQAIYDEQNHRKYFKMSELELATPLGIAHGGTGAATAEGARDNLGLTRHVLYYNDYNRSETTIQLTYNNASVNVSDYDYLTICYATNTDQWASTDVFNPYHKYVPLFSIADWAGDTNLWLKSSIYYIQSSSIRVHNNGWQIALNNGGVTWGERGSAPFTYITQVVGYKL